MRFFQHVTTVDNMERLFVQRKVTVNIGAEDRQHAGLMPWRVLLGTNMEIVVRTAEERVRRMVVEKAIRNFEQHRE